MEESDFRCVLDVFEQSRDSRVQHWDGQTLTEAFAWCSYLQRPHSLSGAQRRLCLALAIDLADTKKSAVIRSHEQAT